MIADLLPGIIGGIVLLAAVAGWALGIEWPGTLVAMATAGALVAGVGWGRHAQRIERGDH